MTDVNTRIEEKIIKYPVEIGDLARHALQLAEKGASEQSIAEQVEAKVRDIVRKLRSEK